MIYLIPILYVISFFANGENKKHNQKVNLLLGLVPIIGILIILIGVGFDKNTDPGVYGSSFAVIVITSALCAIIGMMLAIVKFIWFFKKIYS